MAWWCKTALVGFAVLSAFVAVACLLFFRLISAYVCTDDLDGDDVL